MHYRETIREAVKQLLIDAGTLAGANVYTSRGRAVLDVLRKRENALIVYTSQEKSKREPDGYRYKRELVLTIELVVGGGDSVDQLLDDLAEQVEVAINSDPTLGVVLATDLELLATDAMVSDQGGGLVGHAVLDWQAVYYSSAFDQQPVVDTPVPPGFSPGDIDLVFSVPIHERLAADILAGDYEEPETGVPRPGEPLYSNKSAGGDKWGGEV